MVKCILCGANTLISEKYSVEDYVKGYAHHYGEVPEGLFTDEYEMRMCDNCKLIFANPLKSGSNEFYEWVTKHESYYAKDRWEWHIISDYLKNDTRHNIKLLEVGCGSGYFLEFLKINNPNVETVGVDMTYSSIEVCRSKGLNAFCGTIEDYFNAFPSEQYDYVMSFHCLEHVFNPKEYVQEMLNICKKDGLCINAIPYTDLSIQPWWDVLNSPPHHMTRWTMRAIDELGAQVNCRIEILAKNNFRVFRETIVMLKHKFSSIASQPDEHMNGFSIFMRHPVIFVRELFRNLDREKIECSETIGGRPKKIRAPYHITMIFRKK